MRITGFFLLLAGWMIVLAAVALFGAAPVQAGFMFAGIGVEALGLTFVARSHLVPGRGRE